jgi:hypothetical protein
VTLRWITTVFLVPSLRTSLEDMIVTTDTIREEAQVPQIVPAVVAAGVPQDITEEINIITNLHGLDRMSQILLTGHVEGPRKRFMTNDLAVGAAATIDRTIIE